MNILGPKLIPVTPPSSETAEAEYYLSEVHEIEDMYGFLICDYAKPDVAQFMYASIADAEQARELMRGALRKVVGIAPAYFPP